MIYFLTSIHFILQNSQKSFNSTGSKTSKKSSHSDSDSSSSSSESEAEIDSKSSFRRDSVPQQKEPTEAYIKKGLIEFQKSLY